jgi:proline iminopeptidase
MTDTPYRRGYISVGGGHTLYFEEHGNKHGTPVVVLHGGPGGGLQRSDVRFFDRRRWRIVMFDQRGCGKSKPFATEDGGLRNNTTWDLVEDIERLRRHLEIPHWTVFGGSWGSTLGLAYAIRHTESVVGMILRGICLMELWETQWMYSENGGAAQLFPQQWESFTKPIQGARNTMRAYRRKLRSRNRQTRRRAASAWWKWEHHLSHVRPSAYPDTTTPRQGEAIAALENHYFRHNAWLRPGQLLRGAHNRLRKMPMILVQGELDMVCPARSAGELHQKVPTSRLVIVRGAGHATSEPGMTRALREATDAML